MKRDTSIINSQSGAVFFYILIAIVLLAALSYTVMRNSRTSTGTITEQQSQATASEILEQAEAVSLAFQKLILRGFNETEISFENSIETGYTLASCTTDDCRIFANTGGSLDWLTPPIGANEGENWVYTGILPIWDNGNNTRYDITMILPNISADLCRQLNLNLNVTSNLNDPIPLASDATLGANKLNTASPISTGPNYINGANIDGNIALCVEIDTASGELTGVPNNSYYFVQTLYAG